MALDNALVYRVFGAAIVKTTTGTNNALEVLGYTESGVTLREGYDLEPIMTDIAGPINPGEFQKFGIHVTATCPLISWNPTVWAKIQKLMANSTTAGQVAASGTLVYTGGFTVGVCFVSADTLEDPYYYPTCVIREPTERKHASKHNPLTINVFGTALHLATTTTLANTAVWSRTAPP